MRIVLDADQGVMISVYMIIIFDPAIPCTVGFDWPKNKEKKILLYFLILMPACIWLYGMNLTCVQNRKMLFLVVDGP